MDTKSIADVPAPEPVEEFPSDATPVEFLVAQTLRDLRKLPQDARVDSEKAHQNNVTNRGDVFPRRGGSAARDFPAGKPDSLRDEGE